MVKNLLKNQLLYLFILLILAFILRIVYLQCDTPLWHMYTDEGWKTLDARTFILTGDWYLSPNASPYYLFLFPVFTILEVISFLLFDIGYIQARIFPIICGLLTIFLSYKMVQRLFGGYWGLLAGFFLSFNYFFVMFNRSALVETPVICLMVMSLYFFVADEKRAINWFWSGFIFFLALITKLYAIIIFFCFIFSFIFLAKTNRLNDKSRFSPVLFWFSGLGIALVSWIFLWIIIFDWRTFSDVVALNLNLFFGAFNLKLQGGNVDSSLRFTGIILNYDSISVFWVWLFLRLSARISQIQQLFVNMPIISLLTGFYFVWLIQAPRRLIQTSVLEFFAMMWVLIGLLMVGLAQFSSFHYTIILVPAFVLLSVAFIKNFNFPLFSSNPLLRFGGLLIVFFLLQQIFYSIFITLEKKWLGSLPLQKLTHYFKLDLLITNYIEYGVLPFWYNLTFAEMYEFLQPMMIILSTFLAICIISYGYAFMRLHFLSSRKAHLQIEITRTRLIWAIMILFIGYNGIRFYEFFHTRKYTQVEVSQDIARLIPEEGSLTGGEFLLFNKKIKILHHHLDPLLYRNEITHILQNIYHPFYGKLSLTQFWQNFPNARLVKQYQIEHYLYNLYEIEYKPNHTNKPAK